MTLPKAYSGQRVYMASEDAVSRLEDLLSAATPLIRGAPPRAPERPDHRAWETPVAYENPMPYRLIHGLDELGREMLGEGRQLFGGPLGRSSIEPHYLRISMAERIALGDDPAAVARDLVSLFDSRHCDVLCVFLLAGVEIDQVVSLGEGLDLRPVAALPPSQLRETLCGIDANGTFRGTRAVAPSAALVFTRRDETVIFDLPEPFDPANLPSTAAAQEMHEALRRVLATFVIAGCPSVLHVASYDHYEHPAFAYAGMGDTHSFPGTLPFMVAAAQLDIARALEVLPRVRQLSGSFWNAIELATTRIGRATRSDNLADKALDLGIALELLLLHGEEEPGAKGELRYKIGTRGAWLVAASPEERRTLFGVYRKLYDDRSKAAHTGRIDDKRREALEAARPDVIRLIARLVDMGRFPNWADLVLGLLDAQNVGAEAFSEEVATPAMENLSAQ